MVEGDRDGLHAVYLPHQAADETEGPVAASVRHGAKQLTQYFAGTRRHFDVDLHLDGTPFQVDVWTALTTIPYGQTVTYGELAAEIGKPLAFRAVGTANGKNLLPVILPCHRVVASNGIGGYGGGVPLKRWLLRIEGVTR